MILTGLEHQGPVIPPEADLRQWTAKAVAVPISRAVLCDLCTTNLQDIEFVLHLSRGCLCKFNYRKTLNDNMVVGGLPPVEHRFWLRPTAALGSLW